MVTVWTVGHSTRTAPEFRALLAAHDIELLMLAHGLRTAILCAELLWWRCHRRLIADVLVSLGVDVVHIRDQAHVERHRLSASARLDQGVLTYAALS